MLLIKTIPSICRVQINYLSTQTWENARRQEHCSWKFFRIVEIVNNNQQLFKAKIWKLTWKSAKSENFLSSMIKSILKANLALLCLIFGLYFGLQIGYLFSSVSKLSVRNRVIQSELHIPTVISCALVYHRQ